MTTGLNRQRNNMEQWRDGAPPNADGTPFDPFMAANTPFCGTPRLVLGPDGQQLALARKLKQQNADNAPKSAVDSSQAEVWCCASYNMFCPRTLKQDSHFNYSSYCEHISIAW